MKYYVKGEKVNDHSNREFIGRAVIRSSSGSTNAYLGIKDGKYNDSGDVKKDGNAFESALKMLYEAPYRNLSSARRECNRQNNVYCSPEYKFEYEVISLPDDISFEDFKSYILS